MVQIDNSLAAEGYCGAIREDGTPCMREAGEGIDQVIHRGRCLEHNQRGPPIGSANNPDGSDGPPPGSQNALRHGLYSDFELLYENLDLNGADRAWVDQYTASLTDEWETATEQAPSTMLSRRFRRIAVASLVVQRAFGDLSANGLTTTVERTEPHPETGTEASYELEVPRAVLRDSRLLSRWITDELVDLGLVGSESGPEAADDPWRSSSYELLPDEGDSSSYEIISDEEASDPSTSDDP